MISPNIRFRDIDPVHWGRLVDLMLPPPGGDPRPDAPGRRGGGALSFLMQASAPEPISTLAVSPAMPVVVLVREGRPLRIARLGGGTLPATELTEVSQAGLRALRVKHELPFAVAVDVDALPGLIADIQRRVQMGDDLVVQELGALATLRDAEGRSLWIDPRLFGPTPLPTAAMAQMAFDRLLPDGRSLVFYVVDEGRLWTSLIVAKQQGDVHLVTTHAAIADQVRFRLIGTDARAVNRAVAERIAPPHIGVYLSRRVWCELVAGDRSAIARGLASRQAVLDPAPSWLLALVGAGAMAEAASRSGRLAQKLLSGSKLGSRLLPGQAGKAAGRLIDTLSNPLEVLGIDPWDTLRWGRDWRRRVQMDRRVFGRLDED